MPKIIWSKAEADIKRLFKENYSYRQIKNKLKEEDLDISISSICRILNNIGINRRALSNGEEKVNEEPQLTLDEALIYLDESNRDTRICYVNRGETVPESWVLEKDESFKKGFMLVRILTGIRTVPLIRVTSQVKINVQFYVDYVLKPLFTEHLPKLHRNDMDKVFFHHDKASSHTSHLTTRYFEKMKTELGISYIDKEDIPVKTPDVSPLDFFGFGYLKRRLGKIKARSLDGIWKINQEEWSKIDIRMIEETFLSWKRRLRMIVEKDSEHIEQVKSIHKRLIK